MPSNLPVLYPVWSRTEKTAHLMINAGRPMYGPTLCGIEAGEMTWTTLRRLRPDVRRCRGCHERGLRVYEGLLEFLIQSESPDRRPQRTDVTGAWHYGSLRKGAARRSPRTRTR